MATPESNKPDSSDEIDLGQLFNLIGKGFQKVFRAFLRVYLYFKRNIFWFAGLGILGVLTGYLINQFIEDKLKLEVIVNPTTDDTNYLFDTRVYLYDIVDEIQSRIEARDTAFFRSLGLDADKVKGFEIDIAPLRYQDKEVLEDQIGILDALKEFGNSAAISEILESQFRNKTKKDQRITFYFKETTPGKDYAGKIMGYINSNPYYQGLLQIQEDNAEKRIQRNDSLYRQIDLLIENYTEKMAREQTGSQGQFTLENQESLDVPSLFELKNQLIEDTELKKLELQMTRDPITIVNFGNPHKLDKQLFQKDIIFYPLLFMALFLLISLIRYLNRRTKELEVQ
ncbi:MAG: hypothetical protein WBN56_08400 [Robiginitalea sp.]|uniref:hypothetical protein n=1 Tax=Robiginitalea sp. TaxID=1902411 RepID=UPI003C7559B4